MAALYIGGMGAKGRNFYNDLARRYGYEKEAEQIQDLYLAGKKDEAAALVPRELLELTTLVGPEGYVRERIAALQGGGRHHAQRHPDGEHPRRAGAPDRAGARARLLSPPPALAPGVRGRGTRCTAR